MSYRKGDKVRYICADYPELHGIYTVYEVHRYEDEVWLSLDHDEDGHSIVTGACNVEDPL